MTFVWREAEVWQGFKAQDLRSADAEVAWSTRLGRPTPVRFLGLAVSVLAPDRSLRDG
jgi:hypothetical protein